MKRIAIVGALLLAIGASMTAGTMAKYTQTLEAKTATVTAKKFNIGMDFKRTFDAKIAPGETWNQVFDLNTQDVEVDANYRTYITIDEDSFLGELIKDGRGILTLKKDGKKVDLVQAEDTTSKKIVFDANTIIKATEVKSNYQLSFEWIKGESNLKDTELAGKQAGVSVQITGTQI